MLNFTSEPTRSSNTFNQFSATFRRIFNPFLINGRKSKTKDPDKNPSSHAKSSKLIEECKNSKVYPTLDHPVEILNLNNQPKECPICLLPLPKSTRELDCGHSSCDVCLIKYLKTEISESRVSITCPECPELLHPNRIQELLVNDAHCLRKYEEFIIRKVLITDPDTRYCPAPDCGYAVIATGCSKCPIIQCGREECKTLFCCNCQQSCTSEHKCRNGKPHSSSKKKVSSTRKESKRSRQSGKSSSVDKPDGKTEIKKGAKPDKSKTAEPTDDPTTASTDSTSSGESTSSPTATTEFLNRFNMKRCPSCRILIIKIEDGSCNHMTCSVCGTQFCWLCIKKTSELHYLSPTGCTFFGKRQWSKKKKLFWQFGMLLGAPVFILLSAAIAVPSIIIGLPVWFGRKLQNKLSTKKLGKFKKCVFVTSGVISSAIISPILAAGAVAIGVPFLLAYVYGIVPITLCRSKAQVNGSSEQPMRNSLNEEEAQAFLKQLSEKDAQLMEKSSKKKSSKRSKESDGKSKEKFPLLNVNRSGSDSIEQSSTTSGRTLKDNSSMRAQRGSIDELDDQINYLPASLSAVNSRNSSLDDVLVEGKGRDLFESKLIEVHCDRNGKKFMSKKPNKKLEVKSLENLRDFCTTCDQVHRPCCPNFGH